MNDYGLMRTESDSNKAPQDEQADWLAGRARHFLPLKHYFLNFHFNQQQPPGGPGAAVHEWVESSPLIANSG